MSATVIEKTPLQQKLDEFGQQLSKVRVHRLLQHEFIFYCSVQKGKTTQFYATLRQKKIPLTLPDAFYQFCEFPRGETHQLICNKRPK